MDDSGAGGDPHAAPSETSSQRAVLRAGWLLRKSGRLRRWKRTYAVLKADALACYSGDTRADGAYDELLFRLPLAGRSVVVDLSSTGGSNKHFDFSLVHGREGRAVFGASSLDDRTEWVEAIEAGIADAADRRGSVVSLLNREHELGLSPHHNDHDDHDGRGGGGGSGDNAPGAFDDPDGDGAGVGQRRRLQPMLQQDSPRRPRPDRRVFLAPAADGVGDGSGAASITVWPKVSVGAVAPHLLVVSRYFIHVFETAPDLPTRGDDLGGSIGVGGGPNAGPESVSATIAARDPVRTFPIAVMSAEVFFEDGDTEAASLAIASAGRKYVYTAVDPSDNDAIEGFARQVRLDLRWFWC